MKKAILTLAVAFVAVALYAQPKFGHIISDQLLQAMPEYDTVQMQVQQLQQEYELEIERLQVEINKKIEDYSQSVDAMSDLIRQSKEAEITEMQGRLQAFVQQSQSALQQESMKLIQPVMDKARKAIEDVAKEHSLIYVFDMSQGNPVYASEESLEMLPLVKAKLGVE